MAGYNSDENPMKLVMTLFATSFVITRNILIPAFTGVHLTFYMNVPQVSDIFMQCLAYPGSRVLVIQYIALSMVFIYHRKYPGIGRCEQARYEGINNRGTRVSITGIRGCACGVLSVWAGRGTRVSITGNNRGTRVCMWGVDCVGWEGYGGINNRGTRVSITGHVGC